MPIVLDTTTGTTVGNAVDRLIREYLHAPDEQPVRAPLTEDVTASATTWTIDTSVLTQDEIELMAVGLLVECGQDMRYIKDVAISSGQITVPSTATNGTEAAAHAEGDMVTLNPPYPRRKAFDAVADEIVGLYPELQATGTYEFTTASGYAEVPAAAKQIDKVWWTDGSRWRPGSAELLTEFPPSSTETAVRTRGISAGRTAHLVYRGRFTRPTSEDDALSDLGVDDDHIRIVLAGAAAAMIAGDDVDNSTVEWLTRQLEAQQFPIGSGGDLRDGLLRYRSFLVRKAQAGQHADRPVATSMSIPGTW